MTLPTSAKCIENHWVEIKYSDIKEIVANRLREFIKVLKDDDKFMELIQKKIEENNVSINYDLELSKIDNRLNTLTNITKKVYDDYFEGLINVETYHNLITKYQNEQNDLKIKSNNLLKEKSKKDNYLKDIHKLKEIVNEHLDFKELTKKLVYSLIEKIEITCVGEYNRRKQKIVKITYRFLDVQL